MIPASLQTASSRTNGQSRVDAGALQRLIVGDEVRRSEIMAKLRELSKGQAFDLKMASYFNMLREQSLSRRRLFKMGAGVAGADALSAGTRPFLPGLSVLAQEGSTLTFALEADVRGLEPALAYDFTANPVACQISEGLMMFNDEGGIEPLLAEEYQQPDPVTFVYSLKS